MRDLKVIALMLVMSVFASTRWSGSALNCPYLPTSLQVLYLGVALINFNVGREKTRSGHMAVQAYFTLASREEAII